MESREFAQAARQLVNLAKDTNVLLLAAESEWRQCHRSLIADYLLINNWRVFHFMGEGQYQEHLLRPEARRESIELIYDNHTNRIT